MKVVRIFAGNDGRSHFADIDIPMEPSHFGDRISRLVRGRGVIFREVDGDYDLDFHNAPRRQFVVNLTGSVDIVIGDGATRRLGPGDVLLAEDTTGEGHKSRAVDGQPRKCLFIPIDDDESIAQRGVAADQRVGGRRLDS